MLVKVCGITQAEDARLAAELGAHFCGFIFHRASPRAVSPAWVRTVWTGSMLRVGVFVEDDPNEILAVMKEAKLDLAQLHGKQSVACAKAIGAERVIRVLWPETYGHTAELYHAMEYYADSAAYYLFDSGSHGGGHGMPLAWDELCGLSGPHPWFLAGGLGPSNIVSALWESRPFGIDVNSGVECAPGKKDVAKLQQLFFLLNTRYHERCVGL